MSRTREWLANLATLVGSVIVFLLLCEFVVFRFILPASDVPANAFINDLVRFVPNQSGVWRVRNDVAAPFAINAQGWNSGAGDYAPERRPGVERIAVIGDSFVESFQVPHDRSFGDLVARERGAEAYRFAVSGAPLSQYLYMLEREALGYRPDWIIVLLIHNDFDESFQFKQGRYTSSFMKLRVKDGTVTGEIPPEPWRPGFAEWLRRTATARFFLYRWQVRPQTIVDLFLPRAEATSPAEAAPRREARERYEGNVAIGEVLAEEQNIRAATDHVMKRLAERARDSGARLLVLMDGDRGSFYKRRESQALKLNAIAAEAAARHGVPFLDLHPVFAADWKANGRRFEFPSDGHWNEHAHNLVARVVTEMMRKMTCEAGPCRP